MLQETHKKIASTAQKIKDSFILKQKLTQQQKHELHTKLSKDFLDKDTEFHYLAGMLQHVAESNKSELIPFYYSKMFESCSGCHRKHAKHRFPSFDVEKTEEHHHH